MRNHGVDQTSRIERLPGSAKSVALNISHHGCIPRGALGLRKDLSAARGWVEGRTEGKRVVVCYGYLMTVCLLGLAEVLDCSVTPASVKTAPMGQR